MSESTEHADGGRRTVMEWLTHLFQDEPEDRTELMQMLRDAADRQLMDGEALNIIFGALQVSDAKKVLDVKQNGRLPFQICVRCQVH